MGSLPRLFQKRTEFTQWLADMEPALHRFIASLPPEVGRKLDFSPASLDVLEQWLLDHYQDDRQLTFPEERETWNGLARYIGETYRKELGGYWETELTRKKYAWYGMPYLTGFSPRPTPECPHTLPTAAIDRRQYNYMRDVLEKTRKHEAKWKNAPVPSESPPSPAADATVWFVMFGGELPAIGDVARFLQNKSRWQVDFKSDSTAGSSSEHIVIVEDANSIGIGLRQGQTVLQAALEIATRFASGRSDRDAIGGYDKRFEISFEVGRNMDSLNTACVLEHALREYLGGNAVTFMPETESFA